TYDQSGAPAGGTRSAARASPRTPRRLLPMTAKDVKAGDGEAGPPRAPAAALEARGRGQLPPLKPTIGGPTRGRHPARPPGAGAPAARRAGGGGPVTAPPAGGRPVPSGPTRPTARPDSGCTRRRPRVVSGRLRPNQFSPRPAPGDGGRMAEVYRVEFDRRAYVWDGRSWDGAAGFTVATASVRRQLDGVLPPALRPQAPPPPTPPPPR